MYLCLRNYSCTLTQRAHFPIPKSEVLRELFGYYMVSDHSLSKDLARHLQRSISRCIDRASSKAILPPLETDRSNSAEPRGSQSSATGMDASALFIFPLYNVWGVVSNRTRYVVTCSGFGLAIIVLNLCEGAVMTTTVA